MALGAVIAPGPPEAIGSWESHSNDLAHSVEQKLFQWGAKGVRVVREIPRR